MQLPYADIATPRQHRLDTDFRPAACPKADCPSHSGRPFLCRRQGTFHRKVDLRIVQRYTCRACGKGFSSQTFRLDYRLHKPWLPLTVFQGLVSKTTLRQLSRSLGSKVDTIARHLDLLALHASEIHQLFLQRHARGGGWSSESFQLDELETFETDRRLFPLTVPILIHRDSRFVVHADTGTLPARGQLSPRDQRRRKEHEDLHGKRQNLSKPAVARCIAAVARQLRMGSRIHIQTDQKSTYPAQLREHLGQAFEHTRVHSKARRDRGNLLFPINNLFAQVRDNLSRLVRRNWGNSKREPRLARHLGVWILYRNYVRERSHRHRGQSSAQASGVSRRRLPARELLQWRRMLPAGA